MEILAVAACYVAIHFLIYLLWARNTATLQTERGIFLWHFVSFCIVGVVGLTFTIFVGIPNGWILLLGILALHGIYSLSFLELWSLSQGGYSLGILKLAPLTLNAETTTVAKLAAIGNEKFQVRLASLQNLGLLRQNGSQVRLTWFGHKVALLILLVANIANIKDRG